MAARSDCLCGLVPARSVMRRSTSSIYRLLQDPVDSPTEAPPAIGSISSGATATVAVRSKEDAVAIADAARADPWHRNRAAATPLITNSLYAMLPLDSSRVLPHPTVQVPRIHPQQVFVPGVPNGSLEHPNYALISSPQHSLAQSPVSLSPQSPILKRLTTQDTNDEDVHIAKRGRTNMSSLPTSSDVHYDTLKPILDYVLNVKRAEETVVQYTRKHSSKNQIQQAEQVREHKRQLMATAWLSQNCEYDSNSYVPRSTIFDIYNRVCSRFGIKPLSQASLGKLIKSVFPNLRTRRLGVRGKSKYHYCGLRLVNHNNKNFISGNVTPDSNQNKDNNNHDNNYDNDNDNDDFNSSNAGTNSNPKRESVLPSHAVQHKIIDNESSAQHLIDDMFNDFFMANEVQGAQPTPEIKLPSIDISNTNVPNKAMLNLQMLYQDHYDSIMENAKLRKFELIPKSLFLFNCKTMPSSTFNLFLSDALRDWIFQCDLIIHLSLIKSLSKLIIDHENVSEPILAKLEFFANSYYDYVWQSIKDLPQQIIQKKLKIASFFSKLGKRLIRLLGFIKKFFSDFAKSKQGMLDDWRNFTSVKETSVHTGIDTLDFKLSDSSKDFVHHIITRFLDYEPVHQQKSFRRVPNSLTLYTDSFDDELEVTNNKTVKTDSQNKDLCSSHRDENHIVFIKMVKDVCQTVSRQPQESLSLIIESHITFTDSLINKIILRTTDNIIPWFFLNKIIDHLMFYCLDIVKFTRKYESHKPQLQADLEQVAITC